MEKKNLAYPMIKARANEEATERVVKVRRGEGTNGKETERHRHFLREVSLFIAYDIKLGYSTGTLSEFECNKHDDETGESITGDLLTTHVHVRD